MSNTGGSTWVKFFTNAGIPSSTSATYAHIFVENRIRMDMLDELNNENLREMGIKPMGDIISILRHAKTVNDQSVREKILSSEPARAVVKIPPTSSVTSSVASIAIAPARRVLPEHEGKYKISLPKGSTKKSRDIMVKHSAMQMDKVDSKKSVFDRLDSTNDIEMADSTSNDLMFRPSKQHPTSIFKRLGGYDEVKKVVSEKSSVFAGILKNSPAKQVPKRVTMDTDSEDDSDKMDSDDCKQVSFSPEVEVLEIEPRRKIVFNAKKMNRLKGLRTDGIKNRLGEIKLKRTNDPRGRLHSIKKTITMKPKMSPVKNSKMRADQTPVSVKSRLDLKKDFKNLKLGNKNGNNNHNNFKSSSVFSRLGK